MFAVYAGVVEFADTRDLSFVRIYIRGCLIHPECPHGNVWSRSWLNGE
jgi:hypothetical protein